MEPKAKNPAGRLVRSVLLFLLLLLASAVFYLAIVMSDPQTAAPSDASAQRVLQSSPAQSISEMSELQGLVRSFPAPVLLSIGTNDLQLQSAVSYDVPFENGAARRLTLVYHTADGLTMQVDSIYPARAVSLLESGYSISATAGHTVAGNKTVRMENGSSIRLHMQTQYGLYAITLPRSEERSIASLIKSLQLRSVE